MRRSIISFGLAAIFVLIWPATALAATLPRLGTAGNYAVLAGTTVTDAGASWITGRLGVSPGLAVTGFPPATSGPQDKGSTSPAGQAQTDLITAYNDAATATGATALPAQLGGQTLVAGVYSLGAAQLTGTLILNGGGVYIFQMASSLTTASSSRVVLINGAQPCDIFWQVTSSATIGTATTFVGNILALQSITMVTGATLNGRALARNGAVTLDTNRIIQPSGCGFGVPAYVAPPFGTTLPATLGIPWELIGQFNWLLVIGVGAALGATVMVVNTRRRRRRTT